MRIPMDKDGKARGICFVDFNSKAAAEKGLKKDGQKMQGREVKVVLSANQEAQKRAFIGARKEGTGYQLVDVEMAGRLRGRAAGAYEYCTDSL